MFDAIAPRYDLVNRIMTFRMDVGWRRKTVRSLGLPASSTVLDLACGTGDLCRELASKRAPPDRRRPVLRDAGRRPHRRAAGARRRPAAAAPRRARSSGVTCGFALRNFASLPPFFAELARVVRPGGRVALLEVAEPPNRLLRAGHGFYFGKVVPLVGGLLSDPAAYRYLPRSVAYLPEPSVMLDQLAAAGLRRRRPPPPVRRHRAADHRHGSAPRDRRSSPRTRRVDHDLDLLALAGRDGVLLERGRTGLAGRGVAARGPAGARPTRSLGAHRGRRRGGRARHRARWPSARSPTAPARRPSWWSPRWCGAAPTTAPAGSRPIAAGRRARPRRRPPRPATALPPPSSVTVEPVRPAEWWCELVARATKAMRDAPEGGLSKVVLAREVRVEADVPFDRAVVLERLRRVLPRLLPVPRRRLPRRQPRAAREPHRRRGAGAADGRHRAPRRRPGDRRSARRRPAGVTDLPARAPDHHRHGVRHAASPGAPTSTTSRSRRWSASPTSSTSPPWSRAACRSRRRRSSSWWPRSTPPRRSTAGPATRRRAWIEANEGFDRGRYAGTVGWVDARGNGTFAVSIRCADIDGTTARLVAGNGIVADSDPDTELAETQVKLQAMLSALTRV